MRCVETLSLVLLIWSLAPLDARADSRVETLAYARLTEGYWQIWTYDRATDSHRQRTTSRFDKRDPVWTNEGVLFFRTHNDRLYRVTEAGEEEPAYRRSWPLVDPAWSPDGSQLAYAGLRTDVRDASAIWLISPDGKQRRVLTRGPGLRTHPTWSPDGKWLVYVRSYGPDGTALRRVARDGGTDEEILRDGAFHAHPQWSPDGRAIAYSTNRTGDYEIVVRDIASGDTRALTDSPGLDTRPAWSRDGKAIAFTTYRSGRLEIWTTSADGAAPAPLFSIDDEASDPAWR